MLIQEVVHFLLGALPRVAVAFLDLPGQLVEVAFDLAKLVIGELAPLSLDVTRQLLPLSFERVAIHGVSLQYTPGLKAGGSISLPISTARFKPNPLRPCTQKESL